MDIGLRLTFTGRHTYLHAYYRYSFQEKTDFILSFVVSVSRAHIAACHPTFASIVISGALDPYLLNISTYLYGSRENFVFYLLVGTRLLYEDKLFQYLPTGYLILLSYKRYTVFLLISVNFDEQFNLLIETQSNYSFGVSFPWNPVLQDGYVSMSDTST